MSVEEWEVHSCECGSGRYTVVSAEEWEVHSCECGGVGGTQL